MADGQASKLCDVGLLDWRRVVSFERDGQPWKDLELRVSRGSLPVDSTHFILYRTQGTFVFCHHLNALYIFSWLIWYFPWSWLLPASNADLL